MHTEHTRNIAPDGVVAHLGRALRTPVAATLRQIALVVLFSSVVLVKHDHLCGHLASGSLGRLRRRGGLRERQLRGVVGVDAGAVLRADVVALPVELRRVMARPEELQQRLVRHGSRVEGELHALRVPRGAAADRLVRRVWHLSISISNARAHNARHALKRELWAPKAAQTERGALQAARRRVRDERDGKRDVLARKLVVCVNDNLRSAHGRDHRVAAVAHADCVARLEAGRRLVAGHADEVVVAARAEGVRCGDEKRLRCGSAVERQAEHGGVEARHARLALAEHKVRGAGGALAAVHHATVRSGGRE
jgi:hypothetical protein